MLLAKIPKLVLEHAFIAAGVVEKIDMCRFLEIWGSGTHLELMRIYIQLYKCSLGVLNL